MINSMLRETYRFDDSLKFLADTEAEPLLALKDAYTQSINEYQARLNTVADPEGVVDLYLNVLSQGSLLSSVIQNYTGVDIGITAEDIATSFLQIHEQSNKRLSGLDIAVDIKTAKALMPKFEEAFATDTVQAAIKAAIETKNMEGILPAVKSVLGKEHLTANETFAYLTIAFKCLTPEFDPHSEKPTYDPKKAEPQNQLIPLLVMGKTGLVMTAGGKTISTIFRKLISITQAKRFGDETASAITIAEGPAAANKFDERDTGLEIRGTENEKLTHQHLAQLLGLEIIDITTAQIDHDVQKLKEAFTEAQNGGALLVIDQTQWNFLT